MRGGGVTTMGTWEGGPKVEIEFWLWFRRRDYRIHWFQHGFSYGRN